MPSAGDLPISPAFFFADENGASSMEYVLAVAILVTVGGLALLAVTQLQ